VSKLFYVFLSWFEVLVCSSDMVLTRIKICVMEHVKLRYINCSAQHRDRWRSLVHLVMNLWDP